VLIMYAQSDIYHIIQVFQAIRRKVPYELMHAIWGSKPCWGTETIQGMRGRI
jgi:hypothetical protein